MNDQVRTYINATDKTGRAIASAKRNIKGFGSVARNVLGGLGVGLGGAAFVGLTKSAIDYGSSLTDAAIATNTNIEALQALRYAAQEAGASQQNLDNALIRLTKSTYDAQRGLSTAKDAFALLNINVEEFARLPTERKLEALASGMANATDAGKATGAAMDILGTRNAPKLMEVLQRLGIEGFDFLAEKTRNAGQVMSEETALALDAASDDIEAWKTKQIIWIGETLGAWDRYNKTLSFTKNNTAALADPKLDAIKNQTIAAMAELDALEEELKNLSKGSADDVFGLGGMFAEIGTKEINEQIQAQQAVIDSLKQDFIDAVKENRDAAPPSLIPPGTMTGTVSDLDKIGKLMDDLWKSTVPSLDKVHELMDAANEKESDYMADILEKEKARTEEIRRRLGLDQTSMSNPQDRASVKTPSVWEQDAINRENRLVARGVNFTPYHEFLNPANARGAAGVGGWPVVTTSPSAALGGQDGGAYGDVAGQFKGGSDKALAALRGIAATFAKFAEEVEVISQQVSNSR